MDAERAPAGRAGAVVRQLARYLADHPEAKDTIEGIRRWWLPEGNSHALGEVQEALNEMARREWVLERTLPPHRRLYGANPARLDEMRRFGGTDG
jgi:hypothetical protein